MDEQELKVIESVISLAEEFCPRAGAIKRRGIDTAIADLRRLLEHNEKDLAEFYKLKHGQIKNE